MVDTLDRFFRRRASESASQGSWIAHFTLVIGFALLTMAAPLLAQDQPDLTALKQQLKREILAELCQQIESSAEEVARAHAKLKQEIKQELLEELRQQGLLRPAPKNARPSPATKTSQPQPAASPATAKAPTPPVSAAAPASSPHSAPVVPTATPEVAPTQPADAIHPQAVQTPPTDFGDVRGRVVQHGKPLPGCRVRLVRMESSSFLLLRSVKYGLEFEAVSDQTGNYQFHHIPAGDYKLKWLTPKATTWVRRAKNKPDVTLGKGQTQTLKDLEVGIPTVD